MSQQRSISRVVNVPPAAPGFVGPGHLAAPVVSPENFEMNDPFILLMDDHLDIGDRPVGGPHPHAGFETVTLILDGAIFDRDGLTKIKSRNFAGDIQTVINIGAFFFRWRVLGRFGVAVHRFEPILDRANTVLQRRGCGVALRHDEISAMKQLGLAMAP